MIKKEDFNYYLPPELIAQHPAEKRDHSRLMVLHADTQTIQHRQFLDLPALLNPGDCLVINNSRVIPARLMGSRRDSKTPIEILLLNRINQTDWITLARPGRRVRSGHELVFMPGKLEATVLDVRPDGNRVIRFIFEGLWEDRLAEAGIMPLPPYIHEKLDDPERYQTVYARVDGSVAAPTAGLHFTPGLFNQLEKKGITLAELTLHVGLGTFRPVRTDNILDHRMHNEYYCLSQEAVDTIHATVRAGGNIVAVGTTSCRVLESVAARGPLKAQSGWTDLFIYPGFSFRVVDRLLTNFHLPESTLLMLVAAFAGHQTILQAYEEAIKERYRFFSFGDAMLIDRRTREEER
jgi:S-adenosylmethionine:tRNA ribosyltransferase-isomerase